MSEAPLASISVEILILFFLYELFAISYQTSVEGKQDFLTLSHEKSVFFKFQSIQCY